MAANFIYFAIVGHIRQLLGYLLVCQCHRKHSYVYVMYADSSIFSSFSTFY